MDSDNFSSMGLEGFKKCLKSLIVNDSEIEMDGVNYKVGHITLPDFNFTSEDKYIYLLFDTKRNYTKIGITKNPKQRTSCIKSQGAINGYMFVYMLINQKYYDTEQALLDFFKHDRIKGTEWIKLKPTTMMGALYPSLFKLFDKVFHIYNNEYLEIKKETLLYYKNVFNTIHFVDKQLANKRQLN